MVTSSNVPLPAIFEIGIFVARYQRYHEAIITCPFPPQCPPFSQRSTSTNQMKSTLQTLLLCWNHFRGETICVPIRNSYCSPLWWGCDCGCWHQQWEDPMCASWTTFWVNGRAARKVRFWGGPNVCIKVIGLFSSLRSRLVPVRRLGNVWGGRESILLLE